MAKTKREKMRIVYNFACLILGCALLAFGDAAFLAPLDLITGGTYSVGVIVQYFLDEAGIAFKLVDLVTWGLQLILLGVSFVFLGKKFTLKTIFATLLYPAFFSLFYRIPNTESSLGMLIGRHLMTTLGDGSENTALTILAGIFGGACVGAGVGITYLGGGSTGGFDVLSVIIAKHSRIKEALSSFAIDGSLIVIGMACIKDLPRGLIGILSALVCALMVQFIYVNSNGYVIADIYSDEYEKIMDYVHQKMDRATTLIEVTGGYSGVNRKIVRVAMNKRSVPEVKIAIAEIDPKAFIMLLQADMIIGEGFSPLMDPLTKALAEKKSDSEENGDGRTSL